MELIIQHGNKNALNQIAEIEEKSFSTERFSRRRLHYLLSKARSIVVTATHQNQIVGYAILLQRKNSSKVRLYSIATDPEKRGMGVASKLMQYIANLLDNSIHNAIYLEVNENNLSAIKLYIKFGFEPQNTIVGYYKDGSNALKMIKYLR